MILGEDSLDDTLLSHGGSFSFCIDFLAILLFFFKWLKDQNGGWLRSWLPLSTFQCIYFLHCSLWTTTYFVVVLKAATEENQHTALLPTSSSYKTSMAI